jgi:hypothetical protein
MSVKSSHELKGLESQISKLDGEIAAKENEKQSLTQDIGQKKTMRHSLSQKIKAMTQADADPIVTEHAMLRYIEGVMGLDLEFIKDAILGEGRGDLIKQLGTGKINTQEGFRVVFKEGKVITIVDPSTPRPKMKKKGKSKGK